MTDHMPRAATLASGTTRRLRSHLQRLMRFALALLVALTAFPQIPAASAAEAIAPAAPVATMASTLPLGATVIDYAGGYSSAAPMRLRRAGVGIVVRYVGGSAWKSLTRSEANALRKAGIDIVSVYEPRSAGWMLGGYKAGVKAAKIARAATVKCGGPRSALIYFACDVGTHNYAAVNACLRGAASVLGKEHVGVYGSYYVCNSALKGGYAAKAWQTIAWSNGKVLPSAALYQTAPKVHGSLGLSYDSNFARAEDVGQWAFKPGSLTWAAPSALTTASLSALDFADSSTGLAVGERGTTVGTTDGGSTWTLRSAPTTATLRAVDLTEDDEGWAVGDAGTVIHTADNGSTWVAQSAPTTASLRAVAFADPSSGWAVGDGGAAIRTEDGGATWLPQSTPTTGALNAVDSVDASTGVAVGTGGLVIRTSDAGSTWSTASAPTRTILNAIDMVDGTQRLGCGRRGHRAAHDRRRREVGQAVHAHARETHVGPLPGQRDGLGGGRLRHGAQDHQRRCDLDASVRADNRAGWRSAPHEQQHGVGGRRRRHDSARDGGGPQPVR